MDKIACGNFLAELRNEKQLTQEKLAEILGINNKTVSKWERGNSTPNLETLSDLAEFYQVSLYELQQGKRNKNILISSNDLKRVINKNSITKIMILKIIGIILLLTILIVALYSTIYTFTNYGQMKLYEFKSADENLEISGIFVKTYDSYYLSINSIQCNNGNSLFLNDMTKEIKYSFTSKEYINEYNQVNFQTKTKVKDALTTINFSVTNKPLNKNINHFFLMINYRNEKDEEVNKTFKIILNKKISNTRLVY